MKIQLASDLHFEFLDAQQEQKVLDMFTGEADVLVLAGDIVPLRSIDQVRSILGALCDRYAHVVYVPGNHEYYNTEPESARLLLGAVANEIHNLKVLKNSYLSLNGVKFFGGTMWFPDLEDNFKFKKQLNDFCCITGLEPWCYEQNAEFRKWARAMITEDTIVVSHHSPSFRSVPARFADRVPGGPGVNRFFVSDEETLISALQPRLWLHGHTHDPFDYMLGNTRVVCNPLGYPDDGDGARYNRNLVIDVGGR